MCLSSHQVGKVWCHFCLDLHSFTPRGRVGFVGVLRTASSWPLCFCWQRDNMIGCAVVWLLLVFVFLLRLLFLRGEIWLCPSRHSPWVKEKRWFGSERDLDLGSGTDASIPAHALYTQTTEQYTI